MPACLNLYAFSCIAVKPAVDPCNKGTYCDTGALTADPDDCKLYFQCNNGHWLSRSCSTGSAFDSILLKCESEDQATCQTPCPQFTGSTVSTTPSSNGDLLDHSFFFVN